MKYQNNCRDRTKIPNCRSWRKVEIADFAEAEDKISLKKNYKNWTQIPNCRNWRIQNKGSDINSSTASTKLDLHPSSFNWSNNPCLMFWKMDLKLSFKGMHWACWNILLGMKWMMITILIPAVALTLVNMISTGAASSIKLASQWFDQSDSDTMLK